MSHAESEILVGVLNRELDHLLFRFVLRSHDCVALQHSFDMSAPSDAEKAAVDAIYQACSARANLFQLS